MSDLVSACADFDRIVVPTLNGLDPAERKAHTRAALLAFGKKFGTAKVLADYEKVLADYEAAKAAS
jgi:hypothetical protein